MTLKVVFDAGVAFVTSVAAPGVKPLAVDLWTWYLEKQVPVYCVHESATEDEVVEETLAVTAVGALHEVVALASFEVADALFELNATTLK